MADVNPRKNHKAAYAPVLISTIAPPLLDASEDEAHANESGEHGGHNENEGLVGHGVTPKVTG